MTAGQNSTVMELHVWSILARENGDAIPAFSYHISYLLQDQRALQLSKCSPQRPTHESDYPLAWSDLYKYFGPCYISIFNLKILNLTVKIEFAAYTRKSEPLATVDQPF